MKILENLENLNVSEECYSSIVSLIEEYINEVSKEDVNKKRNKIDQEQASASLKYALVKSKFQNSDGGEEAEKEFKQAEKEFDESNKLTDRFKRTERKWREKKKSGQIKPYKKEG